MTRLYTFDRDVLRAAHIELEKAGFTVSSASPDLLADGHALVVYREHDDYGAVISFHELGHIVHYGAVYLWGGDLESSPKPFKARDIRSRLEAFVAKVCLSVSSIAPGQGARQAELSRAAFSVGGLAEGHGVDSETFRTQLEEAGFACGLEPNRVTATVQTSLRAGIRKPWVLEDKPAPETRKTSTSSGTAWKPSKGGW
jgi:hypothetical protein